MEKNQKSNDQRQKSSHSDHKSKDDKKGVKTNPSTHGWQHQSSSKHDDNSSSDAKEYAYYDDDDINERALKIKKDHSDEKMNERKSKH